MTNRESTHRESNRCGLPQPRSCSTPRGLCFEVWGLISVVLLANVAGAVPRPEIVISTIPGHPSSIIPAWGDGTTIDGRLTELDLIQPSGDKSRWILLARTDASDGDNRLFVAGSGTEAQTVVQQGASTVPGDETLAELANPLAAIANDGSFIFTGRLAGDPRRDTVVVRSGPSELGQAPQLSVVAREGDPTSISGVTYGSFAYSPQLYGDPPQAAFGFRVTGPSVAVNRDDYYFGASGNSVLVIGGETIPTKQSNQTTANIQDGFSFISTCRISDAGKVSYLADLETDGEGITSESSRVFVLAPSVLVQQGSLPTGIKGPVTRIDPFSSRIYPSGRSTAIVSYRPNEGPTEGGIAGAVMVSASVLHETGDLIPETFDGERFSSKYWTAPLSQTFVHVSVNALDEYVVAGFTDHFQIERSFVWIIGDSTPGANAPVQHLLRSGDFIDLGVDHNGDGVNDQAVIYIANRAANIQPSRSGFLQESGWFYTLVDLREYNGTPLGRALIRVPALVGDTNCDGSRSTTDIEAFIQALVDPAGYAQSFPGCDIARADIDGDGSVTSGDIDPFVALLLGS